jgi:hypothetical protein
VIFTVVCDSQIRHRPENRIDPIFYAVSDAAVACGCCIQHENHVHVNTLLRNYVHVNTLLRKAATHLAAILTKMSKHAHIQNFGTKIF